MLGIALDSKDNYNEVAKCVCTVIKSCNNSPCECLNYCWQYRDIYDNIKSAGFTHNAFLTFNPKPKTLACQQLRVNDDYREFIDFHDDYFKKNKNIIQYILVAELTKKGQIHYHCYFSFKSKVTVIKTMVQPMYFTGNILILYGTEPKCGIHYLFKDCETMREYFDDRCSVVVNPTDLLRKGPTGP